MRHHGPRRCFAAILAVAVAIAAPAIGSPSARAEELSRPNVLFIAVDDLRPNLDAFGPSEVETPHIDRLARSGMVFTRAYAQQALCSPSRTSVLTGMRPDTTQVWDLNTHFRTAQPDAITLPQLFKENGYFVQGIGKVFHDGSLNDERSWSVAWTSPTPPAYALPENRPQAGLLGAAFEAADVPDNTYKDGKVAELAVRALRDLDTMGAPFFLAVGFVKPHLPFVAPKRYWDLYEPRTIALAPNPFYPQDAPEYAILPGSELRRYRGVPAESISDDLARQLKHGYYAATSYIDAQIGRLLDELDQLGLLRNTIVVLWSDHGWKLGEHGTWSKHSNVEVDVRVPLIVSVPGVTEAGGRSSRLVELVDIYPTLAELAGLPVPAGIEGTSFEPLLRDPQRSWKTAAFSQYPRSSGDKLLMGYSMRSARYRLTVWVDRADQTQIEAVELYDHREDRQENVNVAMDPARAATLKRLMAMWEKGWRGARPVAK